MQFSHRFFTVCIALSILSACDAVIFNRNRDCEISSWSPWISKKGFTVRMRERAILVHPTGRGKACPNVIMFETDAPPTIKDVAKSLKTYFLKRQGVTTSGKNVGIKRDLLVIIDSSGSIGQTSFKIAKDQIARLLGLLCPINDPFNRQKNLQRAALIEFSSSVKQVFDFDDLENTYIIQQRVKSIGYMGQSTCTAAAFEEAEKMLNVKRGMRIAQDVKQEVLILTDGQSNCNKNATVAARKLQQKAAVFGLMIGKQTLKGEEELKSYVSVPVKQHLFAIDGFQDLKKLLEQIELEINDPRTPPCAPFDIQ